MWFVSSAANARRLGNGYSNAPYLLLSRRAASPDDVVSGPATIVADPAAAAKPRIVFSRLERHPRSVGFAVDRNARHGLYAITNAVNAARCRCAV